MGNKVFGTGQIAQNRLVLNFFSAISSGLSTGNKGENNLKFLTLLLLLDQHLVPSDPNQIRSLPVKRLVRRMVFTQIIGTF